MCVCEITLSDVGIRGILALWDEFGSIPSSQFFEIV